MFSVPGNHLGLSYSTCCSTEQMVVGQRVENKVLMLFYYNPKLYFNSHFFLCSFLDVRGSIGTGRKNLAFLWGGWKNSQNDSNAGSRKDKP